MERTLFPSSISLEQRQSISAEFGLWQNNGASAQECPAFLSRNVSLRLDSRYPLDLHLSIHAQNRPAAAHPSSARARALLLPLRAFGCGKGRAYDGRWGLVLYCIARYDGEGHSCPSLSPYNLAADRTWNEMLVPYTSSSFLRQTASRKQRPSCYFIDFSSLHHHHLPHRFQLG